MQRKAKLDSKRIQHKAKLESEQMRQELVRLQQVDECLRRRRELDQKKARLRAIEQDIREERNESDSVRSAVRTYEVSEPPQAYCEFASVAGLEDSSSSSDGNNGSRNDFSNSYNHRPRAMGPTTFSDAGSVVGNDNPEYPLRGVPRNALS